MKKVLFIFSFVILTFPLLSQPYKNAIGGRLGWGLTASYKHFLSEKNALELYGGLYGYLGASLGAGALFQHHIPIKGLDGLNAYVGGGAVMRTWTYFGYASSLWAGPQACAGLEYKFPSAPFAVSVDWLPTVWLVRPAWYSYYGVSSFSYTGGGLGAKYTF